MNNVNLKKGNTEVYERMPVNPTKYLVEDMIIQTKDDRQRQARSVRIENVSSKLKSGMEMTGDDIEFLKEHASDLYTKAKRVIAERKEREARRKRKSGDEKVDAFEDFLRKLQEKSHLRLQKRRIS